MTVRDEVSEQARECKWSCRREGDESGEAEYQMASSNVGTPSRIQSSSLRADLIMDGPSFVYNTLCLSLNRWGGGGAYIFYDYADT